VSSAGIGGWHVGEEADPRAVAVLRAHGYPIGHAAAQVDRRHLAADLMVALDRGHRRELLRLGVPPERVRLLRSFDPDADGPDVADPYYGDDAGFEVVREQIEAAAPGLLAWARERVERTVTVDACDD
jgi:protein-tyrosine phosphatase